MILLVVALHKCKINSCLYCAAGAAMCPPSGVGVDMEAFSHLIREMSVILTLLIAIRFPILLFSLVQLS